MGFYNRRLGENKDAKNAFYCNNNQICMRFFFPSAKFNQRPGDLEKQLQQEDTADIIRSHSLLSKLSKI